ncbi:MAG: CapA family protein [Anaerolineae bacterium]
MTAGRLASLAGRPVFLLSSLGRTVYALMDTGQIWWRVQAPGPVYDLAVLGRERVAAGDDAGYVTVFDARGRRLWRYSTGSRVTALSGDWQGGVLAGGWDEHLTFLDAGGNDRWQVNLESPVTSITTLPDLAVVGTLDGAIRAFNSLGIQVWRFDAGAPVVRLQSLEIRSGWAILAGIQDGRLINLDPDGLLRWQQTPGEGTGSPVWHGADIIGDQTPELVAGTGGSAPLLALLSAEGKVFWRMAMPSAVGDLVTVDLDGDGRVEILAGLFSGEVQIYDGQGRLRGSVHTGLSVWELEAAAGDLADLTRGTAVLALADVVAWRLVGVNGPTGGPWLRPPTTIPTPPVQLPPYVERRKGEAVLIFLGDVSLGRSMERQLARYGPSHPWEGLRPLLEEADLAVANLEGVLTTQGEPLPKPYLIRAHPYWAQALVEGGFDLVTLANNHALDYGPEGLDETLETLQALDISVVGAGRSYQEAHRPEILTVQGVRIALLGYAAPRWNGSNDVPSTDRIAWAEPSDIRADVRAARDQADVVVVLLHAGTEYASTPSADQVAAAHAAIEAGATLVVGHHPHVVQTVERYRGGLIIYSLGDALFDIPRSAAMQGQLLRVHLTEGGLTQAELWPFWIQDAIQPQLLNDGQGTPQVEVIYP